MRKAVAVTRISNKKAQIAIIFFLFTSPPPFFFHYITVFGENGSGKSTFLKTLVGIIPQLKGKIIYDKSIDPKYECSNKDLISKTGEQICIFSLDIILSFEINI